MASIIPGVRLTFHIWFEKDDFTLQLMCFRYFINQWTFVHDFNTHLPCSPRHFPDRYQLSLTTSEAQGGFEPA